MFCRNCGAQLDAGAKFCTKCGIQVEGMTGGQTGDSQRLELYGHRIRRYGYNEAEHHGDQLL